MAAYLVLLFAVLSRILPHFFATTSVGFTAVGGGLLFFGARRSRWQAIIATLALMATDYYLTVFAYGYPFHISAYVVTWAWYAAICLLGHQMLSGRALHVASWGSGACVFYIFLYYQQLRRLDGRWALPPHWRRPRSLLRSGYPLLCQRRHVHRHHRRRSLRPASPRRQHRGEPPWSSEQSPRRVTFFVIFLAWCSSSDFSFFQGIFEKNECKRWFFGGSGVVNWLVNVVRKTHVFEH